MTTVTFSTSGTWTAPAGVTSVDVQCWGSGGNGGTSAHGSHGGGGGGAGEFAENTSVAVTPGTVYSFTIGTGGGTANTIFTGDSAVTVTAHPGANSPGQGGGAGGTGSTDPVHNDGGAGGSGSLGSSVSGAGGGGSGGSGSAGGAGQSSGTGGTAGTGTAAGAAGGAGGGSLAAGSNGNVPGSGGGGGGSGGSINHGGGTGAAGQITLTYSASVSHPGSASLSGTGSMSGSAAFTGTAGLSGTGSMSAGALLVAGAGASLSGTGSMSAAQGTTRPRSASLSGVGVFGAHTVGFSTSNLSGTGVMGATVAKQFRVALSGRGTLTNSGIVRGRSPVLSGSGTLSVSRVLGVATAGASHGPVTTAQAWPGSTQLAVSPPGSSQRYWLGTLAAVTALKYSFTCPGGCDQLSATVMVPAAYRTNLFNPGWTISGFRGGHRVWTGKMDEPQPSAQGWNLTAVGAGNLGKDYRAYYTSTWPSSEPDQAINNAIGRGLPWVNPGVGQPLGAWFGQAVDSASQTITDLLALVTTRGGLLWYVNSQPGGQIGSTLAVSPLPTTPNRLLTATTPVGRTLGGDINTIFIRYQASADNADTGAQATYALTSIQDTRSVNLHGVMETYVDLSDAGVLTGTQAQAVGNYVLLVYQRASFAGPFTARYGELMNMGGQPIDPGTDQAGTMIQMVMTDFAFGGEVVPGPISWITGAYEWDDFAQTATLTPYQVLNQSLSGLLSLENTLLQPITVSGG